MVGRVVSTSGSYKDPLIPPFCGWIVQSPIFLWPVGRCTRFLFVKICGTFQVTRPGLLVATSLVKEQVFD